MFLAVCILQDIQDGAEGLTPHGFLPRLILSDNWNIPVVIKYALFLLLPLDLLTTMAMSDSFFGSTYMLYLFKKQLWGLGRWLSS